MPNVLLVPDDVTKEAVSLLSERPTMLTTVDRQFDGRFGVEGAKIGDNLRVRKPPQYKAIIGSSFDITGQILDTQEEYVNITANRVATVPIEFGSAERKLSIQDFSANILQPAVESMVAGVEADMQSLTLLSPGEVAATATSLALTDMVQASSQLDLALAPRNGQRYGLLHALSQKGVLVDTKGLFQDASNIGAQYREGRMGMTAGFDNASSSITPVWQAPASDLALAVNDTYGAGDATIDVNAGTGSEVVNKGAIFTIAGVYQVHPLTKASTGQLYKFVAASTTTLSGGAGTITLATPVYATGGRQNVTALPANTAVVTILGAAGKLYRCNLFYNKGAYTFATAPIGDVDGAINSSLSKNGFSVAMVSQGSALTRKNVYRLDMLYGYAAVRPEWGYRILEATA